MIVRYAEWILRWRWLVILATFVSVGLIGYGAKNLGFSTDYRVFFAPENPQLQAFELLQNTYSKSDNVLFVITPPEDTIYTKKTFQLVKELTEQAWQIPFSSRVDSLTNYQHTIAEGDDLIVRDLVENPESLTQSDLEYIKSVASNEPLLVNRLVSPSGHVTGVNVTITQPEKSEDEVPTVVAYSRQLAEEMRQQYPGYDIRLTGIVLMNNAFSEASQNDMTSLVPIMFAVVLLALGFMLRSPVSVVGTLIVIVMAIITAMGLTGWLGWKLTPPSSSAPTIILTMAVADCVHLLSNYLWGLRHGMNKDEAMVNSMRLNFQPIFITSVTTAIGFMSMNFSDVPPFHDLGNIVSFGVMAAFVFSVTFLPAFTVLFPAKVQQYSEGEQTSFDHFAGFVVHNRNRLLWGMSAVAIILFLFIPRLELNDEFVKYFDETIDFRTSTDYSTSNLTGLYTIQYSIHAEDEGGVAEPAFLQKIIDFTEWLKQQPEMLHVNTITDTFKRLNMNMHADQSEWYRLPEERDMASQYLLLYEMSLPYGLDLNDQINVDKSATRVIATMYNLSSVEVLNFEEHANQWLEQNAPELEVAASSPTLMFAHIGQINIRSMLKGTILALVLISIILIGALRSLKLGVVSLVPNLVPAGVAFGIWSIFDGEIGLSLAVVTGMTLGIVVDDTVHFLSKYIRARREKHLNAEEAVRYAFSTVGTALWVTSFVLVCGFLVLSLSSFTLNADMGLMTAITIAIALLFDFTLLPALLMKLEGKNDKS